MPVRTTKSPARGRSTGKTRTVRNNGTNRRTARAVRKANPARSAGIPAALTIATLRKHLLVDGFDIVVDLKKSKGSWLVDARDGKRYLDFFSFVASSPLGMNHPRLTSAEFQKRLAYVATNKPSLSDIYAVEQAEFVDTFSRIAIPSYLQHAFFIEGGALAVENALKASFDWKIRKNFTRGYREERGKQIIHFRQCFHGRSGYTMSLTNTDPVKTALFPKFNWPRVLNPALKFPLTPENISKAERDERASIEEIKKAFIENKDDIAAIIIEPIQGEGGDNHFRLEFFRALRQLADENEAMLIFDEIQTGIGMTGKMWAHEHFVRPDMITFGKKMQVCGFLCGKRIEEVPDNVFAVSSRLNSTWGGNLVDMVRARKYLEVIRDENLVANARVVGDFLLARLKDLAAEFPAIVSNPRGLGLYAAFDVTSADVRTKIRNSCMEQGLIILPSGERSIRFRPALTVSAAEIGQGLEIIRKAINRL
jgi:L-lysine 6-transaminase